MNSLKQLTVFWEKQARAIVASAMMMLKPPPDLTVPEWSDANRYLSSEASAEPGRWVTARAEYQRGIMEAFTDPSVEEVVGMTSAQVGKTELILNLIGYHITQDPAPMLVVQPTVDMGQAFSKDRVRPMFRDSPCFEVMGEARQKDSGDTILHKTFPGGHLTISGANSAASLASRPVRIVLLDEVDRYPPSAGNEGDPVRLAKKRANNFWNRKFIQLSTPTLKGVSRIEKSYEASDKRRFFVPCAKCGNKEPWDQWSSVVWDKDDKGRHKPESASIACSKCQHRHTEAERHAQVKLGEWCATAEFHGIAGFHMNELISPWRPLSALVVDFLSAKNSVEQLKTFVNTVLGEPFEVSGEELDQQVIANRREPYKEPPGDVLLLTAGVDVQDDRIECEVVGWGLGNENWGVQVLMLVGDPGRPELWQRLDDFLRMEFKLADGRKLPISCTVIDSGGHYTQDVYRFTKNKYNRMIFAAKGRAGEGIPIAKKYTRSKKQNQVRLIIVGVDAAKERLLLSWLTLTKPGPGYCHFPSEYDDSYFDQLTAERRVTRYHKGFPVKEWVKVRHRNEKLDCRVYAMAAMELLSPNYELLKARISGGLPSRRGTSDNPPQAPSGAVVPQGDWMGGGGGGLSDDRPF